MSIHTKNLSGITVYLLPTGGKYIKPWAEYLLEALIHINWAEKS